MMRGQSTILDGYLSTQLPQVEGLAESSDILAVRTVPFGGGTIVEARFDVPYLRWSTDGAVTCADGPVEIAIRIGPDYLRAIDPLTVVQVGAIDFWHPNVLWPVVCVGEFRPGMPLVQLLRHVFEIVTYQNFATDDALNPLAAQRLRDEPELLERLLPRTPRLVRRRLALEEVGH